MYLPGDYAYLADLPTPLLCRVHEAETMPLAQGRCQLLRLVPLAGPWPAGTILIRLDHCVRPVDVRNHRPAGTPEAGSRERHFCATTTAANSRIRVPLPWPSLWP